MKIAVSLFLLVGSAALVAPVAHAGKTVKVVTKPLKAGDSGTASETIRMDVDIVMQMGPGAKMDGALNAVQQVERRFEVLAAGATGPIRVAVTYIRADETQTMFGQTETNTMPVAGSTYEVFIDETDSIASILLDGQAPPEDHLEFLVDDVDFIVDGGMTDRVPGTQVLQTGQQIPDVEGIAGSVPGMDPATAKFEAILAGKRKADGAKVAQVDLVFGGDIDQGPMTITFDGSGEIWMDLKRGYIRNMLLEGPLSLTGAETMDNGMTVSFEGKGSMKLQQVVALD